MIISYTVSNIGHGVPFEIFWQDALVSETYSDMKAFQNEVFPFVPF